MAVWFSIILGGYFSVVGIDLSCTEWHICVNGFLPSEEFLAEWVFGISILTASVLTISTMAACIINKSFDSKIKITSSIAAMFIVALIILDSLVIDFKIHAVLVAIHLGVGILLISMVLLTILFAFRISRNPPMV